MSDQIFCMKNVRLTLNFTLHPVYYLTWSEIGLVGIFVQVVSSRLKYITCIKITFNLFFPVSEKRSHLKIFKWKLYDMLTVIENLCSYQCFR